MTSGRPVRRARWWSMRAWPRSSKPVSAKGRARTCSEAASGVTTPRWTWERSSRSEDLSMGVLGGVLVGVGVAVALISVAPGGDGGLLDLFEGDVVVDGGGAAVLELGVDVQDLGEAVFAGAGAQLDANL